MNKKIIIAAVIILIILTVGIIALLLQKEDVNSNDGLYRDPGSGALVDNSGRLSQSSIDDPNADRPTYLGFSFLNERGLSREQVDFTKETLFEYSKEQSQSFSEISLIQDSARYGSEIGETPTVLEFNIKVNRQDDYFVTLTYSDLDSVKVTLYKADEETELFTRG